MNINEFVAMGDGPYSDWLCAREHGVQLTLDGWIASRSGRWFVVENPNWVDAAEWAAAFGV